MPSCNDHHFWVKFSRIQCQGTVKFVHIPNWAHWLTRKVLNLLVKAMLIVDRIGKAKAFFMKRKVDTQLAISAVLTIWPAQRLAISRCDELMWRCDRVLIPCRRWWEGNNADYPECSVMFLFYFPKGSPLLYMTHPSRNLFTSSILSALNIYRGKAFAYKDFVFSSVNGAADYRSEGALCSGRVGCFERKFRKELSCSVAFHTWAEHV